MREGQPKKCDYRMHMCGDSLIKYLHPPIALTIEFRMVDIF